MNMIANSIGTLYRHVLKPLLFTQNPETIHNHFIRFGHILGKYTFTKQLVHALFNYQHPALTQNIHGLSFKNPVGLSAGFDKDGYLANIVEDVGFGFTEIGTVTWRAYSGNPPPRLVRLPKLQALIVNYGLKSDGVQAVIERLRHPSSHTLSKCIQGISVGRTNLPYTHTRAAGIQDYVDCLTALRTQQIGDYYTLNISCPNTCGGEPFTTPDALEQLLQALHVPGITQPVFLKLPIDLSWNELKPLLQIAVHHNIAGVIIGNLTKNRDLLNISSDIARTMPAGGISGKPTVKLSNQLIARTYQEFGSQLIIIGVGGIFSAKDAYEKIKLGASLVQLITGMIYQGPQLIGEINRGVVTLMRDDGFTSIQQAVGSYHTKTARD